jgi:RHS repeat-associated protein
LTRFPESLNLGLNESGNRWADAEKLKSFPRIDNLSSVMAVDLLGNGTACLVWSSSLPGDARAPMRYIDLMGGQKPHLLVKTMNNLGAETHIHYAPSTKFYLVDKAARKPWITRLPFPVHVVERVETYDWISRNRFVTRYAYHHGYFDGVEREFRGFGMVEQWDTEEFAALNANDEFPKATNFDTASHVPPVLSKTWFHTGVYLGRNHVSDFFAGLLNGLDVGEYYREPELDDAQARQLLLEDTILPAGLTIEEEREACRALKGSMLREEVFALDGTDKEPHPFTVTEQNFTIEYLQPEADNRYAVFYVHPCEVINFHYERNPADPRISHALTLQVDKYGNVLKSLSIGYGRRQGLGPLQGHDKDKQEQTMFTCTEHDVTNAVDALDDYRTPLPAETRTYELTGLTLAADAVRFTFNDFAASNFEIFRSLTLIPYEQSMDYSAGQKRLIEQVRTRYRSNNLQGSNDGLLPIGVLQSLALPGETYKLAFTPGLLAQVYERNGQALLLDPASVLDGAGVDKGGYVDLDGDGHWWMPTGRIYYYDDAPAYELNEAHTHFFMPRHFIDPFGQDNKVSYDNFDLLVQETCDALDNRVTVGERDIDPNQPLVREGHNYRVLQPQLIMDPNRNCSEVAFDALCMVVGTAVMGKPEDNPRRGDLIDDNFNPDLTEALIVQHMQAPLADPHSILQRATMRIVYDVFAYHRTKAQVTPDPAVTCTLVRETHDADLDQSQETNVLHSLSYSDGFGQEIQKKIQAEPGPVPKRDQDDRIVIVDGRPEMTSNNHSPRWVGTGWTVFNNKNKPVRRYEPFFTDKHQFEFEIRIGVSPVLFYDPAERMVATLHPNHSWEKIVFDPWCQQIWDVNDTVLIDDPKTDADIGKFFERLSDDEYLPTWYTKRQSGAMGQQEQDAAIKTAVHANTPILAHFDALGRTFLTITHNKFKRSTDSGNDPPTEEFYESRLDLDIEGNQREVIDAKNRTVMRYDYDMLKNRIHQANMEAGERWMLNDTGGNAIRSWDNRGHNFRTEYDTHRRPLNNWVHGTDVDNSDPRTLNHDVLFEKTEYGENRANAMKLNLRTRVFKQYDDAGYVTNEAFDFKGNLLQTSRTLAEHYENISDWSSSVATDGVYLNRTTYDALNRSVTLTAPDNSVIRTTYNEANLLNTIEANLRGEQENNQPKWTPFVTNIDYDAKGQRTLIQYSNGTETRYRYDPDTFRLIHLYTRRGALYTEDCGDEPPPPRYAAPEDPPSNQTCGLQNLHYVYDPAGNITYVRDAAQQTIYFRNRRVEPSNEYTYNATYRLIEATGREHLGQNGPAPLSYNDHLCVGQLHPSDGNAMGRYRQQYVYDAVGNFLEMIHRGTDPAHAGWTRTYTYDEPSLVEPGKRSNRLTSTAIGQITETYSTNGDGYDPHGNMLKMPQLQVVQWDFEDQLRMTQRQAINAQDDEGQQRQGERTYYVYDATGERVRKVTKLTTGQLKDERIYFGRFEICRRHNGTPLVRETLHITDDKQRIALIETKTEVNGQPVQNLQPFQRYQFSNYLGCAVLELNQAAEIISYEEYYPYGSTSYQGINAEISAAAKRYRYSGKERDEESGLYYYGVRYYAVNFGRWCSADPGGILDDLNLYIFAKNNPINLYEKEGMQSESPASLHKVKLIREEFTFKESGEVEIKSKVKVMLHDVGSVRKGIEDASGLTCFYDAKAGVRQYYKKHKDIFYGEEEQAEEYGFIGRLPLSGSARKYRVITYNPEKKPLEYKKKVDVSKLYQEEVFQFAAMSINEGKPLIAGVNLPGYTEEGRSGKIINEGITDHFVVIMGYQAEVLNKNGTESAVITHLYAVDNHTGKRGLLTFAAEHRGRRAVSVGGVAGFSRPQITHLRPWPSQVSALEQGQWASYRNVFGVETRKKFLKKYRKKGTVTGIKIDVFTFYDQ